MVPGGGPGLSPIPADAVTEVAEGTIQPGDSHTMDLHSLLIIEDDRSARNALQGMFISRGWEVAMAATQEEGMHVVADYDPDWIIVAWSQLSGNGTFFFRYVRAHRRRTRLAVLTDGLSPTECAMLKRLQPDMIVAKPFVAEVVFNKCVSYHAAAVTAV